LSNPLRPPAGRHASASIFKNILAAHIQLK
jgi:hypothetical protein